MNAMDILVNALRLFPTFDERFSNFVKTKLQQHEVYLLLGKIEPLKNPISDDDKARALFRRAQNQDSFCDSLSYYPSLYDNFVIITTGYETQNKLCQGYSSIPVGCKTEYKIKNMQFKIVFDQCRSQITISYKAFCFSTWQAVFYSCTYYQYQVILGCFTYLECSNANFVVDACSGSILHSVGWQSMVTGIISGGVPVCKVSSYICAAYPDILKEDLRV
jgi:hypothetical protein